MATAEGLPVFNLKSVASSCAVVGENITVIGEVVNSNAVVSNDITAANTPGTGVLPTSCTVNSTNGTMTQSISLGADRKRRRLRDRNLANFGQCHCRTWP